ncbi:MAG: 3-deoxy-manno-octulosonate cytidylyltransferase [Epsilonproteobacteria bacterium]|nr:3-deoxy-manno-octulosonate cytidylyltransferase [Campylobacterota bacterium]
MIVIPARVESSRFPKKVLVEIGDIPMVIRTAQVAREVDDVVIATDSREVLYVAERYGFKSILTSDSHNSGTDRVYEAVTRLNLKGDEPILNLQADEPFIERHLLEQVMELTLKNRDRGDILINSCYREISDIEAEDANVVKVITDIDDIALYFSRAKIPLQRDIGEDVIYKGHIGLYGFTRDSLEIFCSLPTAPIEAIEKLEQLRALHFGYRVAMVKVQSESFGIDTEDDLKRALDFFMI